MTEGQVVTGKIQALRTEAVKALMKYFARDPAGLDETAVELRDSLIYRAHSIGFHADLLQGHFDQFQKQAQPQVMRGHPKPYLKMVQNAVTFLTDDILFNTASMLDYTGNIVGYTLAGPGHQRIKWNGAAKTSLDKSNVLSGHRAFAAIRDLHVDWVNNLQEVRAGIIHYQARFGEGTRVTSFPEGEPVSRLHFEMPAAVTNRLRFLNTDDEKVDLVAGTLKIAVRSLESATTVMSALTLDLADKLPPTLSDGSPRPK